jgi:cytochrome c
VHAEVRRRKDAGKHLEKHAGNASAQGMSMQTALPVLSFSRRSRLKMTLAWALLALPAGGAFAQTADGQLLARRLNCMSCHAVERTLLGPSFADIAGRYDGKPEARGYLAQKVRTGGVGAWGSAPMPANTQVDAQQAYLLVDWILQTKH